MAIYIDIVFLLNLLIHLITMLSTLIIMNTSLKAKRMISSILLLNVYTFSIYWKQNTIYIYLFLILFVMLYNFRKKAIIATIIFFIAHTTYIYSFVTFMGNSKVIDQVLVVPLSFSWMYTFILCSLIIIIYTGHIYKLKEILTVEQFIYPISIHYQSKTYQVNGFLDSGNQSIYQNKIVIYCLKSIFQENYGIIDYMSVNMINNLTTVPIICSDYIIFKDNKYEDVYIGLVDSLDIEGVSCLLNIKLVYGG